MRMSVERERLVTMLKESISLMCKSSLEYDIELNVEGLLGITLDKKEIMLVNINESFHSAAQMNETGVQEQSEESAEESRRGQERGASVEKNCTPKKRSRKRSHESTVGLYSEPSVETEAEQEYCAEQTDTVKEERSVEDLANCIIIKEEREDDFDGDFVMTGESMDGTYLENHSTNVSLTADHPQEQPCSPDVTANTSIPSRTRPASLQSGNDFRRTHFDRGIPKIRQRRSQFKNVVAMPATTCKYCGKVFQSTSGKRSHERMHLGKVHVCNVCQKAFPSVHDLRRHLWVHNEKKVECQDCHRILRNPDSLASHRRQSCKVLHK